MASIPIYIPTYISDQTYNPSRVLHRLLFFNGMLDCESFYIESGSSFGGVAREQTKFPYFDNYNVVSGSFPTTDSKSLLFLNESAVYGELPTETLYSEYWTKYVELLYNPRTRLLNASTIIPLADYFKMELNDIVELRGNYYHLRAINDYNLKNGECNIQLLGPILDDALVFTTTSTTTAPTTTTTSTSTTSTSTSTSTTTTTAAPTTTTTSTTTSTTTTTAGPTYNYYDVTRFDCPSCTNPAYSLVARNNTTGGTLTTSNYYNNGDGYVYRIDGYNAGTSYTIDLDGSATSGTNCSATCAI